MSERIPVIAFNTEERFSAASATIERLSQIMIAASTKLHGVSNDLLIVNRAIALKFSCRKQNKLERIIHGEQYFGSKLKFLINK